MKLHILSDLHTEFSDYKLCIQEAEVLILAGDIGIGLKGIDYAAQYKKYYKNIIYIPGNHEFYGSHLSKLILEMKPYALSKGIILLDNDSILLEDKFFIGSTLWTDFRLYGDKLEQIGYYMNQSLNNINDFNQIRYASYWFQPSNCASLGIVAQKYIEQELDKNKNTKKIVITHFGPSKKSIAEKYLGNSLNPFFSNNLDYIVEKSDLWIHGHTHESMDYNIKKSRIICNPRGYSKHQEKQENINFKTNLVIEI